MKLVSVREHYSGMILIPSVPLHEFIEDNLLPDDELSGLTVDETYRLITLGVGEQTNIGDEEADLYVYRLLDN